MTCLDPGTIKDLAGIGVLALLVLFGGAFFCIMAWKS